MRYYDYLTGICLLSPMAFSKYYYSKNCHPNGVPKACTVRRSEAGFRPASGYVAAIDFGTTYCSMAYALKGSTEIFKLPLDGPNARVPTAILIDKETNSVAAFGYRAQYQLSRLPRREQKRYVHFERMKMILYRTPVSPFVRSTCYTFQSRARVGHTLLFVA